MVYIFVYFIVYIIHTTISIYFSRSWININRKFISKNQKKDLQLDCIIHYQGFDFYKKIRENNEQRIRAAKLVWDQSGGANFHKKQCKGIPHTIDRSHGIHTTPCYKKFTSIVSSQLKETVTPKRLSRRQSISLESTSTWVYPDDAISVIKLESSTRDRLFYQEKLQLFMPLKLLKSLQRSKTLHYMQKL